MMDSVCSSASEVMTIWRYINSIIIIIIIIIIIMCGISQFRVTLLGFWLWYNNSVFCYWVDDS